ncbi:glutathione S-transferase C-terminal domain-containing protein [Kitasatospora sp. NBC_01539]|uniref:glutathione S-transferase C-terminal domain-containing protein n=1 Tax=Kitasatospora sp. NBC_01539 TaxID=2903577 RepID=UPI00386013EC
MSETVLPGPGHAVPCLPQPGPSALRAEAADPDHRFRSRIGVHRAGGFYPAPHRYQVYLCPDCPDSLRVAITLDLLDLGTAVTTTVLTAPATPDAGESLRLAYAATLHHYDGPLTVPALCDRWSGRIVSNHTPDILRDLAEHLAGPARDDLPGLRPPALADDIDALRDLLDEALTGDAPAEAQHRALALLDGRLDAAPYVLGGRLTAADVDLWVALVRLGGGFGSCPDAGTADLLDGYDRLRAYVRRLHRLPAFHGHVAPERLASFRRAAGGGADPVRPADPAVVPLPQALRIGAA